jgi:hypothetical protein
MKEKPKKVYHGNSFRELLKQYTQDKKQQERLDASTALHSNSSPAGSSDVDRPLRYPLAPKRKES